MMMIQERFLKYVSFDTQSSEDTNQCPSTDKQRLFAEYLRDELERIGLQDVYLDEHSYLYATLPSNTRKESIPTIGFIAHLDTSPDCSGKDIKPRLIRSYDGGDIVLSEGIVSSVEKFPELTNHIGEDLIVTDGHTLLGADDKAGIAEIVTAMEYLVNHPEIEHGRVRVAFNPDEEIGMGAHLFDVNRFGCDFAYTMDGGEVGELEFENFNAASARITINGVSVHPGSAKDKMINAARIAAELVSMLPKTETPETTEGYEGFYHVTNIEGNVEKSHVNIIIRDHDRCRFEERKRRVVEIVEELRRLYGESVITLELADQYYNMREQIEPVMHIIDLAKQAMEDVGVTPKIKAIRGGTDGAQLSFKGLPCPNIFAGGLNFHGPHEFVSLQSMEKATNVILEIIKKCQQ